MLDGKKVVLIAEDEEDLREMYSMALLSGGFEVIEAKNGQEAIDALSKMGAEIDIILMDIVMPEMDGFEALAEIDKNENFRKIPRVVSTNLDNEDDKRQALSLGAADYFVKSQHTPAELVAEVQMILETKK